MIAASERDRAIDGGAARRSSALMRFAAPSGADPVLLEAWNSQYRDALSRYFRRRGVNASDCEDLTQEVFLRLAQQTDLAGVRQAEAYLHRTAANVLTDWHRRARARGAGMHDPIVQDMDLQDDRVSQERIALGRDALARLKQALARMPARTQLVFTLHHFEGLTYAEVARRSGIAVRTVEDHMARANLFLLGAMEQDE
jgi:RNA polymerase sigma-70 factor (ECF subfamily)